MRNLDRKRDALTARAKVAEEWLQQIQTEDAARAIRTLAVEHASRIGVTAEVLSLALEHERRTAHLLKRPCTRAVSVPQAAGR